MWLQLQPSHFNSHSSNTSCWFNQVDRLQLRAHSINLLLPGWTFCIVQYFSCFMIAALFAALCCKLSYHISRSIRGRENLWIYLKVFLSPLRFSSDLSNKIFEPLAIKVHQYIYVRRLFDFHFLTSMESPLSLYIYFNEHKYEHFKRKEGRGLTIKSF